MGMDYSKMWVDSALGGPPQSLRQSPRTVTKHLFPDRISLLSAQGAGTLPDGRIVQIESRERTDTLRDVG